VNAFARAQAASKPLVLVNVWDAASARLVETSGAPAIATSSAALAWALGYPDGEALPLEELLAATRRIVRCVRVPVSVDFEGGYAGSVKDLLRVVDAVRATGAVAVNIEDWDSRGNRLRDADDAYRRIEAVKQRFGDAIYVNARTDIALRNVDVDDAMGEICERLRGFAEAGCDGVFVPGVVDSDAIGTMVGATALPLNVLGVYGSPSIAEFKELGVGRVSLGSGPMKRILYETRAAAEEALVHGTYSFLVPDRTISYDAANALFTNLEGEPARH
jgi:2-methylisocitrate lyase-like PEP mutase family enzyme